MNINKWVVGVVVLIVVVVGGFILLNNKGAAPAQAGTIRIGVMTDLTGPAAYWGQSTRIGAELAAQDLKAKGYDVQLVYEDYGLDATKAASVAQKLANVDNVDAVYAEFNPGAIAAASVLKDKNIPMIYDAAIVSPLTNSNNFFKTYLDYQAGCQAVAQKFKDEGITNIGMLKLNLEAGDLCLSGVKSVYGDKVVVETFNLGDTDFRTQLLKINSSGAGAVINVGFEGDTYNALQVIKNQGYKMKYGTVDDTITDKVKQAFSDQLKGTWAVALRRAAPRREAGGAQAEHGTLADDLADQVVEFCLAVAVIEHRAHDERRIGRAMERDRRSPDRHARLQDVAIEIERHRSVRRFADRRWDDWDHRIALHEVVGMVCRYRRDLSGPEWVQTRPGVEFDARRGHHCLDLIGHADPPRFGCRTILN